MGVSGRNASIYNNYYMHKWAFNYIHKILFYKLKSGVQTA